MKRSHKITETDSNCMLTESKALKEEPDQEENYRSKKLKVLVERISTLEQKVDSVVNLVGQLAECFTPTPCKTYSLKVTHHDNAVTLLPQQPFTEIEEFLEFENKIKNENLALALTADFSNTAFKGLRDFVTKCWRRVFVDSVAKNFCWLGTSEKGCVRDMETAMAIKGAFQLKFPDVCMTVYERKTKQFFHHAKERVAQMEQRRNEKNYRENEEVLQN